MLKCTIMLYHLQRLCQCILEASWIILCLWRWATVQLYSSGDQTTALGPLLAWHRLLRATHANRRREALAGGCNDSSWFHAEDADSGSGSHSAVRAPHTAQTTLCPPLLTERQWTRKKGAPKCLRFCTYAPTCFSIPSWELYFIKALRPKNWLPLVQIANDLTQ